MSMEGSGMPPNIMMIVGKKYINLKILILYIML